MSTVETLAKIIALANQKGGSGKSTVTLANCNALANPPYNKRILLIDSDPQGTCVAIRKKDRLELGWRIFEISKLLNEIFENLSEEEEEVLMEIKEQASKEQAEIFQEIISKILSLEELDSKDLFLSPNEITKIENACERIKGDLVELNKSENEKIENRKVTRIKNLFQTLLECKGSWKPPYTIMNKPADQLFSLIAENANKYDYIFIDMPGRAHSNDIINLLSACDVLAIPLKSGESDQLSSFDFMEYIQKVKSVRLENEMPFTAFGFFNQVKHTVRWKEYMNTMPEDVKESGIEIPNMEDPFSFQKKLISMSLHERTTYEDSNSFSSILTSSGIDRKAKDEFKVFVERFKSLIES
eukprot:TRINITY_DN179610_c0_g4_i2.p1 TRINITY_DN179610_c0_g4~~TRINITY_DN179610_c0_g4_i2.p1  ORF type:complete len:357 (-),score=51.99 TRINITY_DN179610_c0_g4_i2:1370-2440(-)